MIVCLSAEAEYDLETIGDFIACDNRAAYDVMFMGII